MDRLMGQASASTAAATVLLPSSEGGTEATVKADLTRFIAGFNGEVLSSPLVVPSQASHWSGRATIKFATTEVCSSSLSHHEQCR